MKNPGTSEAQPASELITKRIADLGDWRGETLAIMRKLIKAAVPDVVEEWKWMGTPVWSHNGILCTGESYKDKVKLTFAKGASLTDPSTYSTQASTEMFGVRLTFLKVEKLTRRRSRRLCLKRFWSMVLVR